MPLALRELCDHLDATGYPISGSMRLRPEGEALKIWFGADSAAWKMLAGFGAGPDGSTLAFWLVAGGEPAQSPIVHLGSEGDALKVIAKDLEDFLLLFGVGYGELGFADLSLPPGELAAGKSRVVVGTGTNAVLLGEVKAFGKRAMPAADWARGLRLEPGARFDA